jgi:hypothetical protein
LAFTVLTLKSCVTVGCVELLSAEAGSIEFSDSSKANIRALGDGGFSPEQYGEAEALDSECGE